MSKSFDKAAFRDRVSRRSANIIPKEDLEFESLIKQLRDELEVYTKSRERTLALTIAVFKTQLWSKTHTLFADFLMDTFGIKKTYAYLLIKAAEISEANPDKPIQNERQARAHSNPENNGHSESEKPKESPTSTIRSSTDKNSTNGGMRNSVKSGSATVSKVQKEVNKDVLDDTGIPIPEDALPFWNRKEEIRSLMGKISDVKCAIERAKEGNDPMYASVSNSFIVDMRGAYQKLKDEALPYAVCTQCMGSPRLQPDGCYFCKNTGLIPEWKWNTQAIKEVKEMRKKIAADLAAQRK